VTWPDDVDPANGTEPYAGDQASGPESARAGAPDGAGEIFTAPDKIVSVVRAVLERPAEPKVRGLLAVLTSPLGKRLLLDPMLALLPPLDEPAEWDEWLAVMAGCALELASDGVTIDVDQAREHARILLAALFAEGPPGG
jgi:hypothetical protein